MVKANTYIIPKLWMVANGFLASIVVILVKKLYMYEVQPITIIFYRAAVGLLVLLPWIIVRPSYTKIKLSSLKGFLTRGLLSAISMSVWFYSITVLPLAVATALNFTSPLFTTLLAKTYLKEKISKNIILALILGFFGVIIVLRPGSQIFDYNSLMLLASSIMWAAGALVVKTLSNQYHSVTIILYKNLIISIILLPFAWPHLQMLDINVIMLLILMAIAGNLSQIAMVRAYAKAPVSELMPYLFSTLLFTSILNYIFLDNNYDAMAWVGAILIIISAIIATKKHD